MNVLKNKRMSVSVAVVHVIPAVSNTAVRSLGKLGTVRGWAVSFFLLVSYINRTTVLSLKKLS